MTKAANAIATYLTTEAAAAKDLRQTNAQQAAGYWILATDSYADTLEALAAGSDAPWADNRAALARAEAERVAVVAPQNRQREISAAEAAQIQRLAEVDAEKAKVLGKAQAGKTLADAGAQAAYAQALARANAIDADESYGPRPFGMPREVTHFVAIEGSLAVTSDPLDLAAQEGLDDVFGHYLEGWQGDGYYVSIIASMFHVQPAQDELGYTNGFHRFLGENLIRPVVGDDVLINATDGQIVYGTVLISAGLVFSICALPTAIELGMSSFVAAAQAAGIGAVMGAAGGAGMSICAQLDEGKSWDELSFLEIGESAFTGAVGGAIAGFGFAHLSALIPHACVVMPALVAATSGKSVYDGAVNIWHGKYYTGTAQVVTGLTGLWAVGSGLVTRATRALGGKCFVAGTQVVTEMDLPALGVVVATTEAGSESRALSGLVVTLLVVGVAGVIPLERRRRKWEQEEEEERQERDRALNELFHGEDLLDDPDPEENDDWVATMRDDRPMNAVCDEVFGESDNNWSQDPVGWRAPRLDGVEGMAAVSLRQSRAVQVGHAPARRPEAVLIRSARRGPVSRRPLLCRSSIVWLAACLMLGAFCFGGAAWFSSVPDRPTAGANTASTRVTYVTKNIEDVRKGETVVAWDPVTGELGRHEVTNTFERTADHLRVLEFAAEDDGPTQTLETTDEHPFWSVEAEDFVAAGDLRIGDRFISPAGEFSTLVATHRDEHSEGVPVYNFEVADVHNYYVRAHGLRAPPVRVHNAEAYVAPKGPKYTEPTLPSRTIVNRNGVRVEHYTRGNEHMPAHAHVVGGGSRTRIGANGKPLGGDPELSPAQKQVVDESLPEIRKSMNKIRRWWRWNFHLEEP